MFVRLSVTDRLAAGGERTNDLAAFVDSETELLRQMGDTADQARPIGRVWAIHSP